MRHRLIELANDNAQTWAIGYPRMSALVEQGGFARLAQLQRS
jgi:hypothetical protein